MTVQYAAWLGLTLASTILLAQWLRARSFIRKGLTGAIAQIHLARDEKDQAQDDLIGKLRLELEVETRKSAEYFKKISDVCHERDFWRRWYYSQGTEHASAQGYLLNRYEQLAVQYKRDTGKSPKLDPITQELVEQFKDTHPALAEAGRDALEDRIPRKPAEAPVGDSSPVSVERSVEQ